MNFTKQFTKYNFPLLGKIRLPEIKIDDKSKLELNLSINCSNYEFLCKLAKHGYELNKHKLSQDKLQEYQKRAEYELSIFEELGFTDYVLLVWQVINKLKELGGFVDYGRGSCSGSFVFACLGITGIIDVIEKGLIFERFISKVRSKKEIINGETWLDGSLIADADLNLGGFRQDIINWLKEKYKGKVCKIAALSTLTGKILVKDVYKVFNEVNEEEAKRVADLIEKHFGVVEDIEKMPEKNEEFKRWSEEYPETFKIALKLRDLLRQKTSHASGYFISYFDLDGFVPLELNKDKELSISYEMNDAAKFGTKLDLLGLTQNEILTEIFKEIPEKSDEIELDNNPIVYDALQGDFLPYGLYQISADCAYRVVKKIKPKNLFELSDVNAIARPGALDYLDSYVEGNAVCPHPVFEQIVKPTKNLFLYQEQLMKALVAIGFTLDEAEICRKIVGKKLLKEVAEWQDKIKNKVKENNLPEEIGGIIWKVLEDSTKYSFNLAHSFSTAKLGALTVWCKYKYPLVFYKACLNATKNLPNPTEEISKIESELKYFGIKLLGPHILKSQENFVIEGNDIRFSLNSIKGVSEKTLQKIRNFCYEYSDKFEIFKAAEDCGLGMSVLNSLIYAGCLDDYLTQSRPQTALESSLYSLLTPREKIRVGELGKEMGYNLVKIVHYLMLPQNGSDKPFIKESRLKTLRRDYSPYLKIREINGANEKLCSYVTEKSLLGYSYSQNLCEILKEEYIDIKTIAECIGELDDTIVVVGGEFSEMKTGTSKKKNKFIRGRINDTTGSINVMIMEKDFDTNLQLNNNIPLANNMIVMCEGKKTNDIIFCNKIVSQNVKIVTKASEVTND